LDWYNKTWQMFKILLPENELINRIINNFESLKNHKSMTEELQINNWFDDFIDYKDYI